MSPTFRSSRSSIGEAASTNSTSQNAGNSNETPVSAGTLLVVRDYDLATTLTSGQAFRWHQYHTSWQGVIGRQFVRLRESNDGIHASTWPAVNHWDWLTHYLQSDVDLGSIFCSFPVNDPHLGAAVRACRGLRLLRQDPWECLASFILSSTKQIIQIQQIVRRLCERYGSPIPYRPDAPGDRTFPRPETIAALSEDALRDCKMGFRAPSLLAAARRIAEGRLVLDQLRGLPTAEARMRLLDLPGVGDKIANCVLLFAYGAQDAFPVDVWVLKALRELYFPRRRVNRSELDAFVRSHFGPHAGYAQQYLFHYVRVHLRQRLRPTLRSK